MPKVQTHDYLVTPPKACLFPLTTPEMLSNEARCNRRTRIMQDSGLQVEKARAY
jgi:hypothetical protein